MSFAIGIDCFIWAVAIRFCFHHVGALLLVSCEMVEYSEGRSYHGSDDGRRHSTVQLQMVNVKNSSGVALFLLLKTNTTCHADNFCDVPH